MQTPPKQALQGFSEPLHSNWHFAAPPWQLEDSKSICTILEASVAAFSQAVSGHAQLQNGSVEKKGAMSLIPAKALLSILIRAILFIMLG